MAQQGNATARPWQQPGAPHLQRRRQRRQRAVVHPRPRRRLARRQQHREQRRQLRLQALQRAGQGAGGRRAARAAQQQAQRRLAGAGVAAPKLEEEARQGGQPGGCLAVLQQRAAAGHGHVKGGGGVPQQSLPKGQDAAAGRAARPCALPQLPGSFQQLGPPRRRQQRQDLLGTLQRRLVYGCRQGLPAGAACLLPLAVALLLRGGGLAKQGIVFGRQRAAIRHNSRKPVEQPLHPRLLPAAAGLAAQRAQRAVAAARRARQESRQQLRCGHVQLHQLLSQSGGDLHCWSLHREVRRHLFEEPGRQAGAVAGPAGQGRAPVGQEQVAGSAGM